MLNTTHALCDLVDRHPDIVYNRGEAWFYEQLAKVDPHLYERVRTHVRNGRWNLVGGWYLQPDCNLPSGFAMEKQIALGREFFLKEFGQFPSVAYNVDSFGHAATLPGYIHAAGQRHYVMMRPQEEELALPARVFRWRGYADGPEITTFRIAKAYCTPDGLTEEHILSACTGLPDGISHTMCFIGVGDHGGGPTEKMIQWCRERQDSLPGLRLEFSIPQRFFSAIESELHRLPLVVGELQQHAIGSYSVHRPAKVGVRRAEHALVVADKLSNDAKDTADGWRRVCFNHFHDTLGGTCLPSAYRDVDYELGSALAAADESITYAFRRSLRDMPPHPAQRLVFHNPSDTHYDDFVTVEPWLEWTPWQKNWGLADENLAPYPVQTVAAETGYHTQVGLLLPLSIPPGGTRIMHIVEHQDPPVLRESFSTELAFDENEILQFSERRLPLPRLILIEDASDTWSHGLDRYYRAEESRPVWGQVAQVDNGPLMRSWIRSGLVGQSEIREEWRTYSDRPWVDLSIEVLWTEKRKLIKLVWQVVGKSETRIDGIMGGALTRANDGRELPLRDWTLVPDGGADTAIVAPDVFALDADSEMLALTLLRSCPMACHDPNPGTGPRVVFSDQGFQRFRFRFLSSPNISPDIMERHALSFHRPPLKAEVTKGMKTRALRGQYLPTQI